MPPAPEAGVSEHEPYELLRSVADPTDLRRLSPDQLPQLADEIRAFLIDQVSQTGGHLGPNLGVVELTIALHRVFDSPDDPIIFDTGHQSYVHKMLTGRQDGFATLRQKGGLSGYPSRAESEHDWVENSHASTSLSYADGMAHGVRQQRAKSGTVVALVGDGALTGGMAWEALNNIAARRRPAAGDRGQRQRSLLHPDGRWAGPAPRPACAPTRGTSRSSTLVKRRSTGRRCSGSAAYDLLHGIKSGLKDVIAPQGMFSDLGLKYVGPVDGHDEAAVERALRHAKQFGGPVLVHCLTRKGNGYSAAENHEEDRFHAVGKIDAKTGVAIGGPGAVNLDRRLRRGDPQAGGGGRAGRRHHARR